jgi:hypothetical protein
MFIVFVTDDDVHIVDIQQHSEYGGLFTSWNICNGIFGMKHIL